MRIHVGKAIAFWAQEIKALIIDKMRNTMKYINSPDVTQSWAKKKNVGHFAQLLFDAMPISVFLVSYGVCRVW